MLMDVSIVLLTVQGEKEVAQGKNFGIAILIRISRAGGYAWNMRSQL